MKQALIALAVASMAVTSFGASFVWGTGTVKSSFDGTTFSTAGDVGTMYLVLLSTGSASDLFTVNGDEITTADSVQSATPTTTGLASKKGIVTATYKADSIANDQVYGAFFTYTDSTGKLWYNFSSSTYTVSGLNLGTETLENAVFAFNFDSKSEVKASGVSAGGGWQSVTIPEPSTAALALAGLALLLKRRKA